MPSHNSIVIPSQN